jgi:hypothetical protein
MKKIIWWFKPPDKNLRKVPTAVAITLLLIVLTTVAVLAAEFFIDTEGQTEEINGALFIGFFPDTPTGTGNFDPFLRISQSNFDIVQGFNTNAAPQFQEDDTWTSAQNISEIPVIAFEYGGEIRLYRELQLDINQNAGGDGKFLSLDVIEIYITEDPSLTGYDPTTKFGANATLVYDMDELEDNWLKFDYTNNNGSGKRDLKMLIPNEWLTTDSRCIYQGPVPEGSPPSDCPYYFVMYNKFGVNYVNNDGFEEWGSEIYPVASKTGYKYHDLNKNGDRDTGEPGLEGWTIYLDLNNNGQKDAGEPFAITQADDPGTLADETGFYEIQYIIPNPTPEDTWIVREVQQPGWLCSEPAASDAFGCYYDENFAADEVKTGNDFGNYQPALDIDKSVDPSFIRTYSWEIIKDFDATYSKFIGDPATNHSYEITVNRTGYEDSLWIVNGNIIIENNEPIAATITGVSDTLDDGSSVAVDCGVAFPYVLAAGNSLTCSYIAYPTGANATENEATVTTSGTVAGNSITKPVDWNAATITEVNAQVNVTDDYGTGDLGDDRSFGPLNDGDTVGYNRDFACSSDPADYVNGFDSYYVNNIATIDETGDWDDAMVTVNCYLPSIEKTAAGTYDERHEWYVTKTVDPDSQSAFIGETVTFDWTILVTEEVFEEEFDVSGVITVDNPNPDDDLIVPLTDVLNDAAGTAGVIDQTSCAFDGTYLTVSAGGSESCDYSASPTDHTATLNTATIVLNGINFSDDDPIEWTTNVIRGSATLDDDWKYDDEPVYNGWTDTYSGDYTCSTTLENYTNGADLDNEVTNTTIVYSGSIEEDRSTATTEIDCYIPSISKTAAGTYDERHEWDVVKTVTPLNQSGKPGDTLPWTWTIDVIEEVFEEKFDVSGTITVDNPNPDDDLVVPLTDVLNDAAGTAGVIDQTSCAFDGTYLTVSAGGSETCDYSASPTDHTATLNTATIVLNGINFSDDDPIEWTANVIRGSATLSDDEIGLSDVPVSGGDQKTGDDSVTCSTDRSAYGETGSYGDTITNWAYLTDSEDNVYTDDATTTWTCNASFVDIIKTFNGSVDSTKDISFRLYDGNGNDLNDEVSTYGDPDGLLHFQTALRSGDFYTICEYPVPAGYTMEVTLDGEIVSTYPGPPGEANPTGEIQCFDFAAGDTGTTLTFQIDNNYPGGAPRTPGYWKNWSTCTGGNQEETAAKLGGVAEGVYLLDDLLPQTVGSFEITDCEVGVSVLDSRSTDKGKKMANDAAYKLARNLLAARLNQGAEACVPVGTWPYKGDDLSFEQVLAAADTLLTNVGFDGTGKYLDPKNKQDAVLRADALYLAGIIDDYNNSQLCTGEPSH